MTGPMLAWLARARAGHPRARRGRPAAQGRAAGRARARRRARGHRPQRRVGDPAVGRPRRPLVGGRGRRSRDPAELLPEVRPGAEVVGTAPGDVPVVVGGADTPLALLAAGLGGRPARQPRHRRAGPAPGADPRPADDPVVHCYADTEDGWYAMAALQNGGSAWAWVCGVLGLSWRELFDAAAAVPAGAGGVGFRPFLTGERGGVAGPDDRGGWSGLHPGTTRADLARAAVEGVVFAVGAAVDAAGRPRRRSRWSSPAAARAPASSSRCSPTCWGGRSATCPCAAPRRSGRPCWPAGASGSTSSRGGRPARWWSRSRAPELRAAAERWR